MKTHKYITLAVNELKQYENNTRTHSKEQVNQIVESIKTFGFTNPILVDENNVIVAGHGRVEASKVLGIPDVPCIRIEGLTDAEIKALRIADNQLALNAGWDEDMLRIELTDLEQDDFDLNLIGFSPDELAKYLDTEGKEEVEEDEIPADDAVDTRCALGDVWQLGNHRLMCGSSTDANDVAKLLNGGTAKILFTSPPYSDLREYNGGKDLSVGNIAQFISTYRKYTNYQCVNLGLIRRENDIVPYWDDYISIARESGYKLMAWNVWDKLMCGSVGQQSAFIPIRHEWIFVFGTDPFELNRTWEKKEDSINHSGSRKVRQKDGSVKASGRGDTSHKYKKMESVLAVFPELSDIRSMHPATFPIALPSEYIQAMTNEGDAVIEPFGGSGTTIIACEQLQRKCYAMELDPHYCDVIIQRWENLTGEKAVKL